MTFIPPTSCKCYFHRLSTIHWGFAWRGSGRHNVVPHPQRRGAGFRACSWTGLCSSVLGRPIFHAIFRTQELATGKSPASADKNVCATDRWGRLVVWVRRRGAHPPSLCFGVTRGIARPTIPGGAFVDWRLSGANRMAWCAHTTTILAHALAG